VTVTASLDDWWREPGKGRYAQPERERRLLLASVPRDVTDPRVVEDRYLHGTRLRLRRVTDGDRAVHKLTQKVRPDAGDGSLVMTTNIYLDADEYDRLLALPGATLTKTRHRWRRGAHALAVDEFTELFAGLVLAEIDTEGAEEAARFEVTAPVVADVTSDDRFSGAALAHADDRQRVELLRWVRSRVGR
jgi:CYTH domain-containing protein